MKEASFVKFYFAKYFLLAFGLLQWFISALFIVQHGQVPKGQFAAFVFFTTGLIFVCLFMLIADKIKRVAVGKNRIIVFGRQEQTFEWPEVKSIKLIPYFNAYKLKIKGHKKIYFFPEQSAEPIFGMFAEGFKKKK